MNKDMMRAQSESAYKQWAPQWRKQAKTNSIHNMKSLADLENSGVGKAVLCVANGYSLEENIKTIQKNKDNVDIIACDKTMGHLFNHGITPKYVMVCDANVSYETYMKPWENKLQDTILLSNVCGSTEWPAKGNWKDKYFFINCDILGTEKEFSEISGCKNFIPAGTNVSNAMLVILAQSDNDGKRNFFNYDKILLIGYDYSWRFGGKYYAFCEKGGGKDKYMRHQYLQTSDGDFAYSSGNLTFSAQWFEDYVRTFNLPVVNCTTKSILSLKTGNLEEQMQYSFKPEDSSILKQAFDNVRKLEAAKNELLKLIKGIDREHRHSFLASV
jgi:hypothetical protein